MTVSGANGTAQAGSANSITLAANSPSNSDFVNKIVTLTGGTGSGQTGTITAYDTTTKEATVTPNWPTATPDNTTSYSIEKFLRILGVIQGDKFRVGSDDGEFSDGLYTPTLTNTLNIASSTAFECQWYRVINKVTVSGAFTIDPTSAATHTILSISLPVPSALTAVEHCGGVAVARSSVQDCAAIIGNSTDTVVMSWWPIDANSKTWYFHFTYRVI
jgi:hypothetical protein